MSNKNLSSLFPTSRVSDALSGRLQTQNSTDPFGQPMHDSNLGRKVYSDSLTFIERATPSGVGTVTFSSIPTTFTHLMIRCFLFHSTTSPTGYRMYFNGNYSGTKYSMTRVFINDSNNNQQQTNLNTDSFVDIAVTFQDTSFPSSSIILIADYNSSTKSKSAMSLWNAEANGRGEVGQSTGFWNDTNPITSVSIMAQSGGNFGSGTLIDLYGVA
jgi:hypothetical protein